MILMKKILVSFLTALCLLGCKKSDRPKDDETSKPFAYALGTPTGPATNKTIDAAGGNIKTPDGKISVSIPAGALTKSTEISIQPVTQTMESTTGTVYRLGPENVQFEKDVEITFNYTDEDIAGSSEDLLYLAYQDGQGYWRRVVLTGIDKQKKLLFAKTRHFSDWGMERVFYISSAPSTPELAAGQTARLKVYYQDLKKNYDSIDEALSKVIDIPNDNIDGWFVNGPGTLSETKKAITTYKAPESIPEARTIDVGVRVKGLVSKTHPERPGTGGLVIVQVPVNLVPEEYFTWEIDGNKNYAVALDGALLGTTTNIIGTGLTGSVAISLNAVKPGNYDLGNQQTPDMFNLQVSLSNQSTVIYQGTYYNCNESTPRYGKGKITITNYGSIGGFIQGTFTATVYARTSGCQNSSKLVTGSFKIRRKA